jgi:hypothetical protein
VNTEPTTLFALEAGGKVERFFERRQAAAMSRSRHEKVSVVEVLVRAPADGETHTHWGWWEEVGLLGRQVRKFTLVWPTRAQVEMCFTYGAENEERRGRGKLMPVVASVTRVLAEDELKGGAE